MSVSFTAQTMAFQRALESARSAESRLFDDPLAGAFLGRPFRVLAGLARLPVAGGLVARLYDLVFPGPRPSAVARTRLIDDTVAQLVDDGVRNIVILGAGFDSRAWRLPELRHARVVEVDRAGTQTVKAAAVRAAGASVDHVQFLPVDFETDDLATTLRAAGVEDVRALFVWEGVTNYLTAEAVDRTLADLRGVGGPGSVLVFTYVHAGVIDGTATFPEAERWLRNVARVGEPWTFGLRPDQLGDFLAARGYELLWEQSTATAGNRYFPPRGRTDQASELYRVALARITCPD
ncbi:class I SAM-dependent methyltransferase [Nocardia sp. NPDC050175]|uniref:class I SAM-dependent methyltransferase n=1 Tax=Nocardia sp. NPDC050175 TaxID=3364317 RepID=UPI0037B0B319